MLQTKTFLMSSFSCLLYHSSLINSMLVLVHSLRTSCLQTDIMPFLLDFHMIFLHFSLISQFPIAFSSLPTDHPYIFLSSLYIYISSFITDSSITQLLDSFQLTSFCPQWTRQAFLRETFLS